MATPLSSNPPDTKTQQIRVVGLILFLLALSVWGWFDVRKRARLDPLNPDVHKTDLTVYTEAGAAMFDGRDPYVVSNPRGWHYLYPPILAIAMAPLSALPTTEQALVWFAISCLTVWGTIVELQMLWRWWVKQSPGVNTNQISNGPPTWLNVAVLAAMLLPTLNCLQRGQVGVLLIYFLLLGARILLSSSTHWGMCLGGIVLALPVAIKLTPLLPAAVLAGGLLLRDLVALVRARNPIARVISTQNRGIWACVGGLAGLLFWLELFPALTIGSTANHQHLRTWLSRVVTNQDVGAQNDFHFHSIRNQSLGNAVWRLGNFAAYISGASDVSDQAVDNSEVISIVTTMDQSTVRHIVPIVNLICLMAITFLVRRVALDQALGHWAIIFGLACLATVIVSPLSWAHHFVMCWPALLFVPGYFILHGHEQLAKRLAWSAAGLLLLHYIALDFTGRIGLLGIGMTLWCLVSCYQLWQVKATRPIEATVIELPIAQTRTHRPANRRQPARG